MSDLRATTIGSPIGELMLVTGDQGDAAILWPGTEPTSAVGVEPPQVDSADHPVLDVAATQLAEYFAGGRRSFDLPLDPHGTDFQQSAWRILRTIPYGETITYDEQARKLGCPTAARAVGAANGRNPLPIIVPCHRVVGSTGSLTGFAGGIEAKATLLRHERGELRLPLGGH